LILVQESITAGNVTNGDSHDHSGGDGAQISHTGLSNLNSTTYTHLTAANHTDLTDSGNTTLHTHDTKINHALATAANDFLVASGAGAFVKQTLAETKTTLGLGTAAYTAATDYAVAAKGVTNGDSHNHDGGDGAQIAYSALSGTPSLGTMAAETATNYVAKSLYDAQTILQATSDNTPAALTVGEQTVVGRITSGNIAALSVAQLATLLFSAAIPENVEITFTVPSDNGKFGGIVVTGTAGAALAFGDSCYLAVADSRWELTDADAEATSFGLLGVCVLAAAGDGSATKMLLLGFIRADTAFPTFTVGAPVYLSATDGDLTNTAPSGAGDVIRRVGTGVTGDILWFNPDGSFYEHA